MAVAALTPKAVVGESYKCKPISNLTKKKKKEERTIVAEEAHSTQNEILSLQRFAHLIVNAYKFRNPIHSIVFAIVA